MILRSPSSYNDFSIFSTHQEGLSDSVYIMNIFFLTDFSRFVDLLCARWPTGALENVVKGLSLFLQSGQSGSYIYFHLNYAKFSSH